MNIINIISIADNNYIHHFGALLCSIFENKTGNYLLNIYLIEDKTTIDNKNKLKIIEEKYNFKITYLTVDVDKYKSLIINGHFNHSTYYRLSIPNIIDKNIDKILYLDSDIIVNNDLEKLWNIDLKNKFVACVEDICVDNKDKERIGLNKQFRYFNAGVLLINLKKWRDGNIGEKTFEFIKNNSNIIRYLDQDGLNVILKDNTLFIDGKYNVMNFRLGINITPEAKISQNNPYIIHFAPGKKPGNIGCIHPFRSKYYYFLQLTPWKINTTKLIKIKFFDLIYILPNYIVMLIKNSIFYKPISYMIRKYYLNK